MTNTVTLIVHYINTSVTLVLTDLDLGGATRQADRVNTVTHIS